MNRRLPAVIVCALMVAGGHGAAAGQNPFRVGHDLDVILSPEGHSLEAEDVITFRAGETSAAAVHFLLHANLRVESVDPAYVLEQLSEADRPDGYRVGEEGGEIPDVPVREYRLLPAAATWPAEPAIRLKFGGRIHHPPVAEEQEYGRSFSRSPGTIAEEGVVLSGSSFWLPRFRNELVTFRLTLTVPADWDAVSQGERTLHVEDATGRRVRWDCTDPMEEVFLVAGRFTEYSRTVGQVTAYAFLRAPDADLASQYQDATAQYVEMYSRLIGSYPYGKFALVENFWETGYGMPSFTLLGSKVIRFPFILHSSFPHEILHNWWGNSVFVSYERGNWSEGLTAYLADHLVKEAQGRGIDYRRDTLGKYQGYVSEAKDFPLKDFRSRHSSASQAVGYGKSLMVWHMLRLRLGTEIFVEGLQRLYRRHRFTRASFTDVERVFSEVAGADLTPFFRQWVDRTGAPVLSLEAEPLGDRAIRVTVRQDQPGEFYELRVPVALTVVGESQAQISWLAMNGRTSEVEIPLRAPALRIDLDPYFDVFRRLDRRETPPTLGDLFGAESVALLLPEGERDQVKEAWRELARAWSEGASSSVEVFDEGDLQGFPSDRAVWILGSRNRWRGNVIPLLESYGVGIDEEAVRMDGMRLPQKGHSFVYVVRHPEAPDLAAAWIGTDSPAVLPGLTRKLPHYGRYSYLVFAGDEPTNVAKGQWPSVDSPLVRVLGSADSTDASVQPAKLPPPRAALPPRHPLARPAPMVDPNRLMEDIAFLASDALEGRGAGTEGLQKAGEYIAGKFGEAGLAPGANDGSYLQTWVEPDGPDAEAVTLQNIIGVLPGTSQERPGQSVVVGAHYDHLGRGWPDARVGDDGKIHNGADDNASGVAVMLELARLLGKTTRPTHSIVFVAFSGEEWGRKGSRRYVDATTRWPAKEALAMINLDTVGRLDGKKITILGAGSAREWTHIIMGAGFTTGIEVTTVVDDPGGSDQASFHEVGIPAVQVFTGPHPDYHRPGDDVEKIDVEGLVAVTGLVREILVYLDGRDGPLTSTLEAALSGRDAAGAGSVRRVSLGTVPDYSFRGPGVRVVSIVEGSPAAAAGLRDGDVLVAIDDEKLLDLKAYAAMLRKHRPGDVIRISIRRGAQDLMFEAELVPR